MVIKENSECNPISFASEKYYEDEAGNQYRRIAGGLAWPSGSKPGFLIVIGETRRDDPILRRPHLQVLDIYETFVPDELLIRAREFTVKYFVNCIYTDYTNELMLDLLARKDFTLPLTDAPYVGETNAFRQYVSIITQLLQPGRTSLFLGDNKVLISHLEQLGQEQVKSGTAEEYPSVAALAYVASGLHLHRYDPNEQARAGDESLLIGMGQVG